MGRSGIRAAYATGRGRVTIRARHEFEEFGQNRTRIIITEIREGRSLGSFRVSSKLGSQSTVSFSISRSISSDMRARRASVYR